MKIIFDKLNENNEYNISIKEIKTLFSLIPDLAKSIKLVHLQGQEPHMSKFERPVRFESLSKKINISAKGLDKDSIIRELLVELISQNGDDTGLRPVSYRELTKNQMSKIETVIQPIIDKFKKLNKD